MGARVQTTWASDPPEVVVAAPFPPPLNVAHRYTHGSQKPPAPPPKQHGGCLPSAK